MAAPYSKLQVGCGEAEKQKENDRCREAAVVSSIGRDTANAAGYVESFMGRDIFWNVQRRTKYSLQNSNFEHPHLFL